MIVITFRQWEVNLCPRCEGTGKLQFSQIAHGKLCCRSVQISKVKAHRLGKPFFLDPIGGTEYQLTDIVWHQPDPDVLSYRQLCEWLWYLKSTADTPRDTFRCR